jgi:hypothetical protein
VIVRGDGSAPGSSPCGGEQAEKTAIVTKYAVSTLNLAIVHLNLSVQFAIAG